MAQVTMVQAIRAALDHALAEDERVLVLGEDVGILGGVFRATDGLWKTYGETRVMDTPLSESGIVGAALGLALNGFRPVAEIQFLSFIYPAFEQIVSHVSRFRYRTQGRFPLPMVIRAPYGGGIRAPELHSDSCESYFVHTPGLKVVVPSTPKIAKGLLLAAIQDPDPVLFLEPLALYRSLKEEVPEEAYTLPLERAIVRRPGEDITLVAWGAMVQVAMKTAEKVARKGISCEVVDMCSLYPLDEETLARSVKKTGRVVVIHEAPKTCGLGAEILAMLNEHVFYYLQAPMKRVTGYDVPYPFFRLEDVYLPQISRVEKAIEEALEGE